MVNQMERSVLIYIRNSEKTDDGHIEQMGECLAHCKNNGFKVVGIFLDYGPSGATLDQLAMQMLLGLAEQYKDITDVIAVNPHIVAHSGDEYGVIERKLREYGIEFQFADLYNYHADLAESALPQSEDMN